MRICIVTHCFVLTDGQGRINYEIARYLSRKGHEMVLVSTMIDPMLARLPNITWVEVPIPEKVPTALLRNAIFSRRARRLLAADKRGVDILQVNGDIVSLPSDVNVANFVHSNWIKSSFHATYRRDGFYALYLQLYSRLHAHSERWAFRRSHRAVAPSSMVRDSLISDAGIPAEQIEIISPGVDIDQFRPSIAGEPNLLGELIGVSDREFVIMFAGDLRSNRKNLDLVIQAMLQLGPECHLVCAGASERSPYPAMVASLGLSSRVHFIGKRADLGNLFRGANVFAFPSHYDPFALVITEAMASGLPVITTPTTGASTFIERGVNGFVLKDSNDLDGMAMTLKRLNADRDLAAAMGKAARATAREWTWEKMAYSYESLYKMVVSEKRNVIDHRPASAFPTTYIEAD